MAPPEPLGERWPHRLETLLGEVRAAPGGEREESARRDIWVALNLCVGRYLRLHAPRLGRFAREDLEDLASQKSLELIRNLDTGVGALRGLTAADLPGFVSTVARNALVDRLREGERYSRPVDEEEEVDEVIGMRVPSPERSDADVERREFAEALRDCAQYLSDRDRLMWFFRVFYDMRTKDIAKHPEVGVKPGLVDVVLSNVRKSIRECMRRRGYEPRDMPCDAFVELWRTFRMKTVAEMEAKT
jgi:RNA polymerase sigma factor (sigma-70 family)